MSFFFQFLKIKNKSLLSCQYFIRNTSCLFSKKTVLPWYFSQIFNENPSTPNPIFDQKKRQFCQNFTILLAQKVNKMPFLSNFSRKCNCSCTKNLSKKNPSCHAPIWSKKVNSVKTTLLHGRKSQ